MSAPGLHLTTVTFFTDVEVPFQFLDDFIPVTKTSEYFNKEKYVY